MIPLLQMKTADTAHTGIFASDTRVSGPKWPIDFWHEINEIQQFRI